MTQRVSVVQPADFFEIPLAEEIEPEEKSESDQNFYEAFDAVNTGLFWIVIMLISYVMVFSVVLLVILTDRKSKFLAHHLDETLSTHTSNLTSIMTTASTTNTISTSSTIASIEGKG